LAEIHQRYPTTTRILLTGYADLDMIVKAINEGQIHRYISKPWNDEELQLTLRQALAHQHSERERQRLELLSREQNEALQSLNASLEKRVAARMSELQQTADMLDLAYDELKHSYATSTEVFSLLVNQRLPQNKQTNRQIIDLVRTYCKLHPMDAARLILHHQERWDGTGFPDHLKGEAIPFGSRLLKLAVDFIELQRGLILERQMNSDEALVFIRKYAGRLYDPELVEDFVQVCASYLSDVTLGDPTVKVVGTRELQGGMVLARNLNADNGMLLLNAGKVLNPALVEKLIAFEAMEKAKYSVFIKEFEAQHANAIADPS
jgi:response regulator RpfG family c-di-GMP phosphodiesterase